MPSTVLDTRVTHRILCFGGTYTLVGKAKNKHVGKRATSVRQVLLKKKKAPREGDEGMEGDGGNVGFNDTISLR